MLSSFCSVRAASLLSFLIGVGVDVSVAVAVRLLGAGADGVRRLLEDKADGAVAGVAGVPLSPHRICTSSSLGEDAMTRMNLQYASLRPELTKSTREMEEQ